MKLLTRTTLAFLAYAGLVLLAGTFIFYAIVRTLNVHDVDEALTLRKEQVQHQLATLTNPADLALWMRLDQDLELHPALPGSVPPDRITEVAGYDSVAREAEPQRQLDTRVTYQGRPYRLLLRRSLVENDELLSGLATAQAILLALLLTGMLVLQAGLNRWLWRPFYRTLAQLRGFRLDQPAAPPVAFAPTTTHEFRELHAALRQLLDHSQRTYRSQREFTENASHELQTPLAVLRAKLEQLLQAPGLTEEQAGHLDALLAVTQRLTRLNRSLLLLTRLENQPAAPAETVDLAALVQAQLGQLEEQVAAAGLTMTTAIAGPVPVAAPRALLDILVSNLLTNAIRHNRPGGTVHVALTATGLRVENTGRPHPLPAGQEFARFRKAADSTPGGVGLGLAIAHQVAESCGFGLRYDYPAAGRHALTVTFLLPRHPERPATV